MAAAFVTTLLLAFSGTTTLGIALWPMLGAHALIGLGEGAITVAALRFVTQSRPDMISAETDKGKSRIILGLLAIFVTILLAPFASSSPDGLMWVAERAGFVDNAQTTSFQLLPDYTIPGLDGNLSTILAGLVGALLVGAIVFIASKRLARKQHPTA